MCQFPTEQHQRGGQREGPVVKRGSVERAPLRRAGLQSLLDDERLQAIQHDENRQVLNDRLVEMEAALASLIRF